MQGLRRFMPVSERQVLLGLLIAATVLFLAGVLTPVMTLSKFVIFDNSFSVLSGIVELLTSGHLLLFLLIAGFSLALPLLKMAVLFRLLYLHPDSGTPATRRCLHLMHEYGRWAMLDVLVVAMLVVTVKLGAIASIAVHYGLYLFGAAVLLIMLITHRTVRLMSSSVE